ncbi:MAG: cytochrome c biogenesis CcdA family protein [Dermatophilaceae bacterium]
MTSLVADGNLLLAALVALLAGVVSFASPCVLPLVPGFLGYVAALPARSPGRAADRARHAPYASRGTPGREAAASAGREAAASAGRGRALLGAALFVLGFSVVFLAGTLAASAVGVALAEHRRVLSQVGGVVVIALALVFLGVGGQGSWSPRWRPSAGLAGAPLLGMVFAIGWAPCMGPTLAVIYALATNLGGDASAMARGLALGVAYCVGLGLPFLALAAGWSRASAASAWLRRHRRGMKVFGGSLLLVVGVLLVTGWWDVLVVRLQATLVGSFIPVL